MPSPVKAGPPNDADSILARAILECLLPVQRRFPSLRLGGSATPAATCAGNAALFRVFGSMTLADAIEAHLALWRFLNSDHADRPRADTAQDDCLYWAWRRLADFARFAPAATADDAAARARFIAWNAETGSAASPAQIVSECEAIAADFARLTAGAPIPAAATFARWCSHE